MNSQLTSSVEFFLCVAWCISGHSVRCIIY